MHKTYRNIERAREEPAQLHGELLHWEKRVNPVRESFGKAIKELFGTDRQAFPALEEGTFFSRIAKAVLLRLPVAVFGDVIPYFSRSQTRVLVTMTFRRGPAPSGCSAETIVSLSPSSL